VTIARGAPGRIVGGAPGLLQCAGMIAWGAPAQPGLPDVTSPRALPQAADPELKLLLPDGDVVDPELSIVVPALNESLTIATFVEWCLEGLRAAGVQGEILIVDSSTDATAEIARAKGARVLVAPKRGLGRAYIDALPYIRGRYVLMGDCDCTYDFRQIAPFMEQLRAGAEFVMGSRFRGFIEPGSMPPLHRYLGTPVTTWILNVIFGSRFSDIHCGMRAITRDALVRMGLQSQSWEYASEMVLKSVHMRLRLGEVPIRFLKDREGRVSHHKRAGWFSPWQAAWINLRAMFIYGAAFFLYRPGFVMLALGLLLLVPLSLGPVTLGPITFQLHWMLLGLTLATLGMQSIYLGILVQIFFDYSGEPTRRWYARFPYTRTVFACAAAFIVGLALNVSLGVYYLEHQFRLSNELMLNHLAVTGLFLMIAGFVTFAFVLLLHSTAVVVWRRGGTLPE
jgi:glycosyltransferase involved in cell wall biosynthesis